jgi:hypothetical protein
MSGFVPLAGGKRTFNNIAEGRDFVSGTRPGGVVSSRPFVEMIDIAQDLIGQAVS